jgi:hypothetical protein
MKRLWHYITGQEESSPLPPPFNVHQLFDDHLTEVFRHFTKLEDARHAKLVCKQWNEAYWNMRRVDATYLNRLELPWVATYDARPVLCWKIQQNPECYYGPSRIAFVGGGNKLRTMDTRGYVSCFRDSVQIVLPTGIRPSFFEFFHGQGEDEARLLLCKRILMRIWHPQGGIELYHIHEILREKIKPWVQFTAMVVFGKEGRVKGPIQRCFRCGTISDVYRALLKICSDEFGAGRQLLDQYENGLLERLYTWPPFQRDPSEDFKGMQLYSNPN